MTNYAIIVENDESQWDDTLGEKYHYPNRYQKYLEYGTRVIYYKGKLTNPRFELTRLSPDPHYLGSAIIGTSFEDPNSNKADRYCYILQFEAFTKAVSFKLNGEYLERIPDSRRSNYWRDGVRNIDEATYNRIMSQAEIEYIKRRLPKEDDEFESTRRVEGKSKERFSTYYERDPRLRADAIRIHGLTCMVCKIDFETRYGELGRGYIHVHHNKPICETGPTEIDPDTDLSVLCPNCHAMIHRKKAETLSVEELGKLFRRQLLRQ